MLNSKDSSRIFLSKRVSEIASGDFSFLLDVAFFYRDCLESKFKVRDVFECAYADLSKNYRSEYFYKNIVAEKILLGRHSLNTATVLSEFRVGKSKADCVMLNGCSVCYEIKSDFDNLDRLPEQIFFYKKIFDKVNVVVGKAHVSRVKEICSNDVGVIELTSRGNLRVLREAKFNNNDIDVPVLMRSLRVNEYTEIASIVSNKKIEFKNTEVFFECERILSNAPSKEVRKAFCDVLKKTRKVEGDYVLSLPRSLLMAGIWFRFNSNQKRSLVENLNMVFSKDELCTTRFCEENNLS